MNYGQLKAAIAARLGRTNLTAVIPDFIMLGESRLYHGFRDLDVSVPGLRLRSQLAIETVSLATLPADFLAVDRLTVPGARAPRALTFVPQEEFVALPPTSCPQHFTLMNGLIVVEGGTPAVFTLSYYKKFSALVADADTNWLLSNAPNIMLYSALIEAYAHLKDDARVPTAGRMYAAAANALIDSDDRERHSGSSLSIGSAR